MLGWWWRLLVPSSSCDVHWHALSTWPDGKWSVPRCPLTDWSANELGSPTHMVVGADLR